MTHDQSNDSNSAHRFFHAMVLMGSSLALGCGGATSSGSADDDTNVGGASAGGAKPGGASAGGAQAGGAPASGATFGGASSGVAGAPIPVGGQATMDPEPPSCPPAQWDCSGDPPVCWGEAYALPAACGCDRQRPLTVADCGAGETFVCRVGSKPIEGIVVNDVPFECSCVPSSEDTCVSTCDDAYSSRGSCEATPVGDKQSVLCNCALIVLR